MRTIFTTLTLLLASSATAFGATADFFFFNKLGLLIGLNAVLGGLLTLCFAVIASRLREKLRRNQPLPVQIRHAQEPPRSSRASRNAASLSSRKAANEQG